MSSVTILVLVLVGVVALLLIGGLNHALEKNKLEKARRKAELIDRYRRCANLSDRLPGQLMSRELKQLLSRLELHFIEQLRAIDQQEPSYAQRAEALQQLLAKGNELPIDNAPVKILSDEQLKEVRFQLESLQAQIIRAIEEQVIAQAQGKLWVTQIRKMLVQTYIEYFTHLGDQFLASNRPGQARLVFERAVQFLKKQKDVSVYQQSLRSFEASLAQANALVLEHAQAELEKTRERSAALVEQQDDQWKKKQIYD